MLMVLAYLKGLLHLMAMTASDQKTIINQLLEYYSYLYK